VVCKPKKFGNHWSSLTAKIKKNDMTWKKVGNIGSRKRCFLHNQQSLHSLDEKIANGSFNQFKFI